jgi:hypothetical protein
MLGTIVWRGILPRQAHITARTLPGSFKHPAEKARLRTRRENPVLRDGMPGHAFVSDKYRLSSFKGRTTDFQHALITFEHPVAEHHVDMHAAKNLDYQIRNSYVT